MASSLKATDLATLDRKWREPGRKFSFRPSLRSIRVRLSEPATTPPTKMATESISRTAVTRPIPLGRGVAVGLTLAAITAAAVTVLAMRRGAPDAPPGVIIVEGSVAALGVSAQPAVPADTGGVLPAKAAESQPPNAEPSARAMTTAPGPGGNVKPASPKSRSELLTRAFQKQEPRIARCFTQHASDVTGNPEISVRFEVGMDGHVQSAQVQPAALGSTLLGQCIVAIARATDFGSQPEPTSFRIPITAKRGP